MAQSMRGKLCIVTGANNGFGFVTAQRLTEMGATVVMICRSRERGQAAQQRIRDATGHQPELLLADLSLQAQVRRVAADVRAAHGRLDVLINNAGFSWPEREETEEGFERTFALNYLAYFTLTLELVDLLIASAPARVVNIASSAHRWRDLALDNLQGERDYPVRRFPPLPQMYGWTNVCRIMFTYELAERLAGRGVTANALCPGFVPVTRSTVGPLFNGLSRAMQWIPGVRTPEQAAETIVYLASDPRAAALTGTYHESDVRMRSSEQTYDRAVRKQLWSKTLALAGYEIDPLPTETPPRS